jgi:hypothetical protein
MQIKCPARVALNRPASRREVYRLCAWFSAHIAQKRSLERGIGVYRLTSDCVLSQVALTGQIDAVRDAIARVCEIAIDQGCPDFCADPVEILDESGIWLDDCDEDPCPITAGDDVFAGLRGEGAH